MPRGKTRPMAKTQMRQILISETNSTMTSSRVAEAAVTTTTPILFNSKPSSHPRQYLSTSPSSSPPKPSSHPRRASNPSGTQTTRCPRRQSQTDPSTPAHPSSSSPTPFRTSSPRSVPPRPTPSQVYPTIRSPVRESPTCSTFCSTPSRRKNSTG